MEEEAIAASTEGRTGAQEGSEGEEAPAAQAGSVQKRCEQDTTGKSTPAEGSTAQSRTSQGPSN